MSILRVLSAAVVGMALSAQAGALHAETRVALVIGNEAYKNVAPLKNPASDAKVIADALKQVGFDVTVANNLDRDGFGKALDAFRPVADGADWAVVYYAGHGIEIGEVDYLVPIDAKLKSAGDVPAETIPLDQALSAAAGAHKLRVIVFDASRNNPFPDEKEAVGKGQAPVKSSKGSTLVLYSTEAGGVASEGESANSPLAAALAKHLTEPGVEITQMLRVVHDEVLTATSAEQTPFVYASLRGEFYFVPKP